MLLPRFYVRIAVISALLSCSWLFARPALAYQKATEGVDVVKNKLFPKKGKVEVDGKFGFVLNSSYQSTFLANAGLSYFFTEEWGINIEGNFALNSDKSERDCVETFYNDPHGQIGPECHSQGGDLTDDSKNDATFGPAYVPIRELKYIFSGNAVWNPIYGKQIILLSATNYFDFYMAMGGGIAMSDFYPESKTLQDANQTQSRGPYTEGQAYPYGTKDDSYIGKAGRPVPEAQTNPLVHFSVGERFHFMRRFLISAELKNYTLLGTQSGFDNFFTLMGGVGVRF